MTPRRWSAWGALVCALAFTLPATAAPVPDEADKTPALAQVPAKSAIVVQLRGFERTRERLNVLIKAAMPDFADLAKEKMDEALKKALDGRELKGITKDGSIFLVFTELPSPGEKTPKMAILVPVSNYESFRNGLLTEDERKALKTDPLGYETTNIKDEQVFFVNRKNGYAVVSPDADVAASFVKKYDGLKLTKALAHSLMDADLSVYVDMAAVNKTYGDGIKQAQSAIETAVDNVPDKGIADLIKRITGTLFQAVGDSTAFLVSVDLRPEGVLLHLEAEVPADSKTNALLKDWKSLPVASLAKLPAGQMAYSSIALNPGMMKEFGALAAGLFQDPDSEDGKAIQKAFDALAAAKPREKISASNVPASGLEVTKYEDPAKGVEAQLKLFKSLKEGSSFGAVLKGAPVIKENAEKYAGFELHSVSVKWDLEKTVDKQAAALPEETKKAILGYMKSLLGEGSNIWFGTDGKAVIAVTAKDWPAARKLIDRYQKGDGPLGEMQAYKDTVKHLPPKASIVALVDVPKYSEFLAKSIVSMLQGTGLPIPIPAGIETPAIHPKTTYLGFSVTLESGRASLDLWVSAQSANDVYKMYLERLLKPNF